MASKKAVDLLLEYMPRFRAVELVPLCWNRRDYQDRPQLILDVMRGAAEVPFTAGYRWCIYDFKEAGRSFPFSYDPGQGRNVLQQFYDAAAHDVVQALAGKRFVIEPSTPFTSLMDDRGHDWFRPYLVVRSLDGDIPGLKLPTGNEGYNAMLTFWQSYVPPESPEGRAISAAHKYERLMMATVRDVAAERAQAAAAYEAALQAVA